MSTPFRKALLPPTVLSIAVDSRFMEVTRLVDGTPDKPDPYVEYRIRAVSPEGNTRGLYLPVRDRRKSVVAAAAGLNAEGLPETERERIAQTVIDAVSASNAQGIILRGKARGDKPGHPALYLRDTKDGEEPAMALTTTGLTTEKPERYEVERLGEQPRSFAWVSWAQEEKGRRCVVVTVTNTDHRVRIAKTRPAKKPGMLNRRGEILGVSRERFEDQIKDLGREKSNHRPVPAAEPETV